MKCLPSSSRKVAAPPSSLRMRSAASILCWRVLPLKSCRCSRATARPAARIPARKSCGLTRRENIDMRSETSRPYAFGNNCSASGPRAYVTCGLRTPGFMPDWDTSLSRSRLARCARTALSVRRSSAASSFTVRSLVRRRSRTFPLVLLNNRSRQPICFIGSKIMRIQSKSKECLTNSLADSVRGRSLFAEERMMLCF
jgi:hypothetical protein